MTLRKALDCLADMYPAGKETCANCGESNMAGEGFSLKKGWSFERICADCEAAETRLEKYKRAKELQNDEEISTSHEDEVVCPWCGYEYCDSWEFSDEEMDCEECGKTFEISVYTEITYSTERVEKDH